MHRVLPYRKSEGNMTRNQLLVAWAGLGVYFGCLLVKSFIGVNRYATWSFESYIDELQKVFERSLGYGFLILVVTALVVLTLGWYDRRKKE